MKEGEGIHLWWVWTVLILVKLTVTVYARLQIEVLSETDLFAQYLVYYCLNIYAAQLVSLEHQASERLMCHLLRVKHNKTFTHLSNPVLYCFQAQTTTCNRDNNPD